MEVIGGLILVVIAAVSVKVENRKSFRESQLNKNQL